MSMTVNHSNPISSPSQEVVPLSEHNALIEQMSHMLLTTMQADQTVQEKTNRLIQTFQVSMQELQMQNELLMRRNEQLETQIVTLEGHVKELKATHKAELRSLGIDRFEDVNELVKEIIAVIPSYTYLSKQKKDNAIWNMLSHLGAGRKPGERLDQPLFQRSLYWAKTPEEHAYDRLLREFYPRMKHLSSRELAEPMKITYEINNRVSFSHWYGWDIEIVILTPDVMQLMQS
ncbi:MAG: hypothetical protein K0S74_1141 [Chlamydiales bacterium]|nr:hypothetical protein [Chlamydiales bacterium]